MPQAHIARWLDSFGRRSFIGRALGWLTGAELAAGKLTTHPKVVLLMRHGEKKGKKADIHLNARGNDRAKALPKLFPGAFPAPDYILAAKTSARSNRPVETVTPLAKALGLGVETPFASNQYTELARHLLENPKYQDKTILVCWRHGKIPGLAAELGFTGPLPAWTQQQFDRVWRIEYTPGGVTFANLPQRLLPGDSPV